MCVRKGGGFIPYKLGPKGVYTFTVELVKGGGVFHGGRIRWYAAVRRLRRITCCMSWISKTFWAEVIEKGKKLERAKIQHGMENQKRSPSRSKSRRTTLCIGSRGPAASGWCSIRSPKPGRNFTAGKFGFLIQGNDEIGISDFTFQPNEEFVARGSSFVVTRRRFLSAALVGLTAKAEPRIAGEFVNDAFPLGHRIRDHAHFEAPSRVEKFPIVIVGGGIAGLSAAWRLQKRGFRDFVLLEMEPSARRQFALGRKRDHRVSLGRPLRPCSRCARDAGARAVRRAGRFRKRQVG